VNPDAACRSSKLTASGPGAPGRLRVAVNDLRRLSMFSAQDRESSCRSQAVEQPGPGSSQPRSSGSSMTPALRIKLRQVRRRLGPLEARNVAVGKFLLRHSSVRRGQTLVTVDHRRRTKSQVRSQTRLSQTRWLPGSRRSHHLRRHKRDPAFGDRLRDLGHADQVGRPAARYAHSHPPPATAGASLSANAGLAGCAGELPPSVTGPW
jgi:hypothetical protein